MGVPIPTHLVDSDDREEEAEVCDGDSSRDGEAGAYGDCSDEPLGLPGKVCRDHQLAVDWCNRVQHSLDRVADDGALHIGRHKLPRGQKRLHTSET